MNKGRAYLTVKNAILFFVVVVFAFLGYFGSKEYEKWLVQDGRQRVTGVLVLYKNSLESTIKSRLGLVEGLERFVMSRNDKEINRDFSVFAPGLDNNFAGIRNIGVAPGGVLSLIYPTLGNEQALGYNLLTDQTPSVKGDVTKLIQIRSAILSNPFELRQGGLGIAIRKAIFKQDKLWGFVSVVTDVPVVIYTSGLDVKTENFNFSLRDKTGHVFWGDPIVFEGNPVIQKIDTTDGYWELGGLIGGGWRGSATNALNIFRLVALLVGVLILSLLSQILSRDIPLVISEGSISERTKSLKVVVIYATISFLWIFYSDRALAAIFVDAELINQLQTLKGWLFVVVTSIIIYWLIEVSYGKYLVTSRALRSVLASSRLLISVKNKEDLYRGICDVLVKDGGYQLAWVGLVAKDKRKLLIPVAVSGREDGFFKDVTMTTVEALGESSPCSAAISTKEPIIINDIAAVSSYPEWKLAAEKRNFMSSMTIPLIDKGTVFGLLEIYSSKSNSLTSGGAEILRRFAEDLTYGIQTMNSKKQGTQSLLLNYQKNKKDGK